MKDDIEIIDELRSSLQLAVGLISSLAEASEIDLDETRINARTKGGNLVASITISEALKKWSDIAQPK